MERNIVIYRWNKYIWSVFIHLKYLLGLIFKDFNLNLAKKEYHNKLYKMLLAIVWNSKTLKLSALYYFFKHPPPTYTHMGTILPLAKILSEIFIMKTKMQTPSRCLQQIVSCSIQLDLPLWNIVGNYIWVS